MNATARFGLFMQSFGHCIASFVVNQAFKWKAFVARHIIDDVPADLEDHF